MNISLSARICRTARGVARVPAPLTIESAGRGCTALCPAKWRSSWATRPMTPGQSPRVVWRKSRIEGYQGLSSRPSSQRQSGANESSVHTGLPSAPARCAIAVSTEITRSSWLITAAVSATSSSAGDKSTIRSVSSDAPISPARSPFCRLKKVTPSMRSSGSSANKEGSERSRSLSKSGFQPARCMDPLLESGYTPGIQRQIGHDRRNRLMPGFEDVHQAHQRGMRVEARQRLTGQDHLIDARCRREQPRQPRATVQQNTAAALPHHRRVAHELDCIPQALLGAQQNGPAWKRPPIPDRPLETGRRHERCHPPAPFVLGRAGREIAPQQQRFAEIAVGPSKIGLECNGTPVALYRLVQVSLLLKQRAEFPVRLGIARLQHNGMAIALCRLVDPPE